MTLATAVDDVLVVLDRMEEIVSRDMLTRGSYVVRVDHRPLCGGKVVCAVGALYLAAGINVVNYGWQAAYLPGVQPWQRTEFMRDKPALAGAYAALNTAALERIDADPDHLGIDSCRVAVHGALEALFELGNRRDLGPDAEFMGQIIRRAKELVESETR